MIAESRAGQDKGHGMPERMTFETLKAAVSRGEIDTVITCFPDMQGRLLGKRQHARYFIESGHDYGGCCNYLLVTDLAMRTVESFRAATWAQGYGDYALRPDLDTLRPMPWLEKTAMVLCDVLDPRTMEPVAHAPRQMLKAQLARLSAMGLSACMATELEFFLFRK
jgi:glutamine synthetase